MLLRGDRHGKTAHRCRPASAAVRNIFAADRKPRDLSGNCRRILEYNDIRIVVQTAELVLEIWGSDLQADSRSPESLVIHGQIQSITLTPKGVRHGTASAE